MSNGYDMDTDTNRLRRYYEELRGTEHAKNTLIEDILQRLDTVTNLYEQEKLDHARESRFNRQVQLEQQSLNSELRKARAAVERDQFVLVLIDGDGMIFEEYLLIQGEAGGKEAADKLWNCVKDYVHQKLPDLPSDFRIVTRIYANLKGLGDVCSRSGILSSPSQLEDFARGFTGTKQLFDFIDVGSGKDRADDKISELFKLYLHNSHCRHILFGCSHDNGYARLLEDISDRPVIDSVTLLEGVPFERELAALKSKYETTRFNGLFRTSKVNMYPQYSQGLAPPTSQSQSSSYQSPYQNLTQRSSTSATLNPAANTWANAAIAAPPTHMASPPPTPKPQSSSARIHGIQRNRFGERVDPIMKYDKEEVNRVRKIKMCNVHFLRGDCPYGDECTHTHFYKPNKNEIQTLKFVARGTPCRFGTACDDEKCIYGHNCPVAKPGAKECIFGDNCRFDKDMHGVDSKVVKTTKV
ncbi:hypothetical protein MMC09_004987 [Bachmanniomyces sp. S44760]|nr:hypothetical protein [Bachmanniomyces sp. S44760]